MLTVAIRERLTSRKEKYANITVYCHQISSITRDLNTYIILNQPPHAGSVREYEQFFEVVKTKTREILDQLALIFVSLTGTRCRTSIKLIYPVGDEAYYFTFTRDHTSLEHCRERDDQRAERNHDPLKKNAQFSKLFDHSSGTRTYFCNDLSCDPAFTSTSFTAYDPHWAETGLHEKKNLFGKLKLRRWPLPYRSTICCVIRHGAASFLPGLKPLVLGFVTVDSESRNVFEPRWDPPLLSMVADNLFHPLKQYLEIQNKVASRVEAAHAGQSGT